MTTSRKLIPLSVPEIRGNEWRYVKECLDTNWVSSVGPFVDRFERMMAEYLGAEHAVATVNGTAALHIALLLAGVEPGDEVLVPTLTFISPANAVRYAGAVPVFVDVEPEHWQMDPGLVSEFLERECRWADGALHNKATGRRIAAVLPVHLLGHPVDVDPVLEVVRKYGLHVVEDATESLGAMYKERPVGKLGDIACFSFNGNKIVTTGGGGMVVTDDDELASRAKYLTTQAKDHPVEYVHNEIGYNYRLSNLLAAIGCAQMEQVDGYVAAKRRIAASYDQGFEDVPGISGMKEASWAFSTYWMYTALVDEAEFDMDSRALLAALEEAEIQARPLWQPMHLSRAHAGAQSVLSGVSERLYAQAISLPCSVGLSTADQERVLDTVRDLANGSGRGGRA
jgi:perosamine synthetase